MQERSARFLIVAGILAALGLPFAIAFPRTLLEKMLAVGALVAAAAAIAWVVMALRKDRGIK